MSPPAVALFPEVEEHPPMIATAKMAAATRAEVFRNEVTGRGYRSGRRCLGPCVDKPEDLEGSCSAKAFLINEHQ
jgi:hypothetical protein